MSAEKGSPAKSVGSGESNVSAMLDLRNGRKRAEADLQLLSNRISLLRNEEARAMTKITETKNRAKEILIMKKKNEQMAKNRQSKLLGSDDASRHNKDKVAKQKAEREKRISASKQIVAESRLRAAAATKEDSRKYDEINKQNKDYMQEQRKQRALEIQRKKDQVRRKREQERAEKERQAQLAYAKKMAEEAKKTKEAEDLIEVLEREELALIERLKKTQMLQEKAYSTLQHSLDL